MARNLIVCVEGLLLVDLFGTIRELRNALCCDDFNNTRTS